MKRAILIDGNNLLFRSYYATAYSGNLMKNSKNFPTNALYGFINMINKIISEEKPEYIMVAFDKGKNFRHEKYENYKAGRIETPNDLLVQFPYAYKILDALGIVALNADNYEADDIIGTFAKMADLDKEYDATIVSSDKDLLQLISRDVNVKLLKQKDYIMMNEKVFRETYQTEPIKMIDLKALMGDASDNIPGVKGIGEKTAINLISTYGSLEGVYDNLDKISPKTREKLENDKENAFFSKDLATIYRDVPLNMSFEDIKKKDMNKEQLLNIYRDLEFYSLLKKLDDISSDNQLSLFDNQPKEKLDINKVKDKISISKDFSFYLELDEENYHQANVIGMGIYDGENSYYLNEEAIKLNSDIFSYAKSTYDLKKSLVVLNKYGINFSNVDFDLMIVGYLLELNTKEDISYLANQKGYEIKFYDELIKKKEVLDENTLIENVCLKAKFIYENKEDYISDLNREGMIDLFNNIELSLIRVLAKMEMTGIRASKEVLDEMQKEIEAKLEIISNSIYNMVGEEFNIASPKQLGEILFEKINLPHGKKQGRNGYPTDHDTLVKIMHLHPVIPLILEHRNLNKIMNTYMDSLKKYIREDGKIHTIYKQAITRTGRLSSVEPNLQNIPIRSEEGKNIRKAFLGENGSVIMSSDYSQIELRVLAHISNDKNLIDAFMNSEDIHTKVASDIYGIDVETVSKSERRTAKAVIFGIVYGISGFGLGENLDIDTKEASKLIDKYLNLYPGVKKYMEDIILEAKSKGYVRTLFNRKRVINELNNTNYMIRKAGERIALNTPIQGTSADIIKMAMIEVDKEITKRNLKSKMLIQVHDELVFSVPLEEKEEMEILVRDVMENIYKLSVPLKVEIESGTNWYNAK